MGKKLFISLIVGVFLVVVGTLALGIESSNNTSTTYTQNEDLIVLNDKGREQKEIIVTAQTDKNEFDALPIQEQKSENKKTIKNKATSLDTATGSTEIKSTKKPIFDTTLYLHKNTSNNIFFKSMCILYQDKLLSGKGHTEIDIDFLKSVAKNLPKSSIPYILDIEIWDVHTTDDVEANKNIDKYILVIDTMKQVRPDLKFGYYGVLPNRDYWAPVRNSQKDIEEWDYINKRLKRLADHVDVVCPSLYTFVNDYSQWKKYAIEHIKRARTYGKPIYPFLCPQFHVSNPKVGGQFVEKSLWEEQIKIISDNSDGVIIWGGYDLKTMAGPLEWDENAPWWQVTKKFIMDESK